jgi:hypothetical protein
MAWNKVTKPSSSSYTNVNPTGREQYDQINLTYDESTVFYDGVNQSAWTNVAKPTGAIDLVTGMSMGMLVPLTSSRTLEIDKWIDVAKPT